MTRLPSALSHHRSAVRRGDARPRSQSLLETVGARSYLAALIFTLLTALSPAVAGAEGLEVTEVRTDNFPRVIVRFAANLPDGTPIANLRPGQLKIWENGATQEPVDFYSLRESSPELWAILVVDLSGSMNDADKLNQAKLAAKAFISRLRPKDRTAIVTFSDKIILQQQPTGDPGILGRAIDALQAKGPTRMNDGLARGVSEALRGREGARKAVILLSDGEDTDSQLDLAAAVKPAVEARIPIYTIGLGPDVKSDILSGIAGDTKGRYYAAPQASDLDYVFKLLSGQLSSQFEAWWPSSTVAPSGSPVQGRLVIEQPGNAPFEASFGYTMPVFFRPIPREEPVATSSLKEVELPAPGSGWDLPAWWPLEAAALAAIGIYVGYYGLILRLTRTRLQTRLQSFVGGYHGPRGPLPQGKQPQRQSMRPLVLRLAKLSHRMMPTRVLDDLRHRLVLAGRPSGWHFSQFLAAKLVLAAGLGIGSYIGFKATDSPPLNLLAIVGCLTMLGYYLPHYWLGAQIRARQKAIRRALPDSLDLITVGVGAGLSFDGAVLEIVQKSDNELTRELANYLAELRMGRSRREALQGLQARTEVDDLKTLVASLIQSEELGMSLSETLMVQADQMRLRRRQRAEELAHKATIKMMFPMVMLIFPALFVVIIGPAVPGMMAFLSGG